MGRMDFATLYGYYLLAEEGLVIYNPKYVSRYGMSMWCLKQINVRATKATSDYLRESYTNAAESAKFYATYPKDLTGATRGELRALRSAARRADA